MSNTKWLDDFLNSSINERIMKKVTANYIERIRQRHEEMLTTNRYATIEDALEDFSKRIGLPQLEKRAIKRQLVIEAAFNPRQVIAVDESDISDLLQEIPVAQPEVIEAPKKKKSIIDVDFLKREKEKKDKPSRFTLEGKKQELEEWRENLAELQRIPEDQRDPKQAREIAQLITKINEREEYILAKEREVEAPREFKKKKIESNAFFLQDFAKNLQETIQSGTNDPLQMSFLDAFNEKDAEQKKINLKDLKDKNLTLQDLELYKGRPKNLSDEELDLVGRDSSQGYDVNHGEFVKCMVCGYINDEDPTTLPISHLGTHEKQLLIGKFETSEEDWSKYNYWDRLVEAYQYSYPFASFESRDKELQSLINTITDSNVKKNEEELKEYADVLINKPFGDLKKKDVSGPKTVIDTRLITEKQLSEKDREEFGVIGIINKLKNSLPKEQRVVWTDFDYNKVRTDESMLDEIRKIGKSTKANFSQADTGEILRLIKVSLGITEIDENGKETYPEIGKLSDRNISIDEFRSVFSDILRSFVENADVHINPAYVTKHKGKIHPLSKYDPKALLTEEEKKDIKEKNKIKSRSEIENFVNKSHPNLSDDEKLKLIDELHAKEIARYTGREKTIEKEKASVKRLQWACWKCKKMNQASFSSANPAIENSLACQWCGANKQIQVFSKNKRGQAVLHIEWPLSINKDKPWDSKFSSPREYVIHDPRINIGSFTYAVHKDDPAANAKDYVVETTIEKKSPEEMIGLRVGQKIDIGGEKQEIAALLENQLITLPENPQVVPLIEARAYQPFSFESDKKSVYFIESTEGKIQDKKSSGYTDVKTVKYDLDTRKRKDVVLRVCHTQGAWDKEGGKASRRELATTTINVEPVFNGDKVLLYNVFTPKSDGSFASKTYGNRLWDIIDVTRTDEKAKLLEEAKIEEIKKENKKASSEEMIKSAAREAVHIDKNFSEDGKIYFFEVERLDKDKLKDLGVKVEKVGEIKASLVQDSIITRLARQRYLRKLLLGDKYESK